MAKRTTNRPGEKEADGDKDRSLFEKVIEAVISFWLCALLLRLAVGYILSVRVPLLIITTIIAIAVIAYRMHKWKDRHDDY